MQVNAFHHRYPADIPSAIELTADPKRIAGALALVKDMFLPLRAEVERAVTLDQAIERILLSLPASQKGVRHRGRTPVLP